ncbi:hypothetical protein IM538_08035 [Cytobacillus suaedae]|nr:hypothetical protein IM538_08035 [Cytobacillus suaedae]
MYPIPFPDEPTILSRVIGIIALLLDLTGVVFGVLAINKEKLKIVGFAGFILNLLIALFWLSFFFSFGSGGYFLKDILEYIS